MNSRPATDLPSIALPFTRDGLLRHAASGLTCRQVAEIHYCSTSVVRRWAKRWCIRMAQRDPPQPRSDTASRLPPSMPLARLDWLALQRQHGTATAVARAVGCCVPSAVKYIRRSGGTVTLVAHTRRREAAGLRQQIIARLQSGELRASIAASVGRTRQRIDQIARAAGIPPNTRAQRAALRQPLKECA